MIRYEDIKSVHLEISSLCNASCPDCPRNVRGVNLNEGEFEQRDMRLEEAKKIFTPDFLKQLDIILINGNYGDFITCRDGLEIVKYFSQSNPNLKISISTNASGQPKIWSELGAIPNLQIQFRLDGLADTHDIYRQYTSFDLIIKNAKNFISAGGYAIWTMIKFDHNLHQIDQAEQMSRDLGFKKFELMDMGRSNMVVFDRDRKFKGIIGSPIEIITDFNQILEQRQSRKDNPSDIGMFRGIKIKKIDCKVKGPSQIYVQSNGQVYPCCWLGFYPDINIMREGNQQIKAISENNNALDNGIARAVEWFSKVEQSWHLPTFELGRLLTCNETCGC